MKRSTILTLSLAFFCVGSQGAPVLLADLGSLQLDYVPAAAVDSYQGRPMAAQAGFRPGEALSLVTPYRVSQIRYLAAPGARVNKGDSIALLAGPEIHHSTTEFQVIAERLANAERRFKRNRELYQRKAIDERQWIEISDTYYALQLEYEHMRHFRELLKPADEEDALWLTSPAEGILQYRQSAPGLAAGEELAIVIPAAALRLRVAVPLAQRQHISALSFADCELAVASISGIADNYFVEAWSDSLTDTCALLPGERLMVTPVMQVKGYRIPREAVFQWQGQSAVLLKKGDSLETVSVKLLASKGTDYFVTSDVDLSGRSILSNSVSAVQGVMLGLGGN